jgi:hypothetical protein
MDRRLACLAMLATAAAAAPPATAEGVVAPADLGDAVAQASAPPPATSLPSEGFVLIADEKGVKVYRREKRPGIELAAAGNLAGSVDRVRRVLTDYPSHQRWQKHLKESRVLGRGDGFLDVYQRLDLPLIDDRDFVLHVTWGDEATVGWMRFAAATGIGPPPVKGVVRVTQHEGGWRLEPLDGGRATYAVYRFYLDLAGSFPAWMGKGQAASDLPELFANITRQLPSYP